MKRPYLLFILFIALTGISCKKLSGSGPVITEQRAVTDFSYIKMQLDAQVYIVQDSNYDLKIEAQQNIADVIRTEVNDGVLVLKTKSNTIIRPDEPVKIYIRLPQPRRLEIDGPGNYYADDTLNINNLTLKINGSGNMFLNEVHVQNIQAAINGSGDMNINHGTAVNETVAIHGSGAYNAENLRAINGDINISGSGNARVFITTDMKVRISGSGDVYYKGSPTIEVHISGSGKIHQM